MDHFLYRDGVLQRDMHPARIYAFDFDRSGQATRMMWSSAQAAARVGFWQNPASAYRLLQVVTAILATGIVALWWPAAGQRAMLMGFPLVEAEDMPDAGADATPIAFGDFSRGYLVVDRTGVRVLRDPYSAKPYVLFYTTKRVGGGVQDFDAIKLLKYGVS